MVILDTNIIIDHLRQSPDKVSFLRKVSNKISKENLSISVISIQELYEGQSTKKENKEKYLLATISPLKILPYTYEIAKLAGEIAREYKGNIELADAAIAATTIINGGSLFSLNKKHFQGIRELEIVSF